MTFRTKIGMRGAVAVLLMGALVSLSGCSSDAATLDRAATERAVTKAIQADLAQEVERVTCPEDLPLGEGEMVRCDVALVDVAGVVGLDVEQVADDELDVTLLDAVIDPVAVADELERQLLATYLRTFTADCGRRGAKVLAPGSTVPCTVTDDGDGGERAATATIDDAAGTLRFSVADAPEPPATAGPPADPDGPPADSPADGN